MNGEATRERNLLIGEQIIVGDLFENCLHRGGRRVLKMDAADILNVRVTVPCTNGL